MEEAITLKNKIYETFSCDKEVQSASLELDSAILGSPLSEHPGKFTTSNILDKMKYEQIKFLKDILNNPVRIEKLFRASEQGFKAEAFHDRCNNQSDTLVLVRTEFGKTIGGFTHYPWLPGNKGSTNDAGRRTFIFSLDMREKFVPQNDNNLIFNYDSFGPTFGSGNCDIFIADECNNNNSFSYFPSTYNRVGEDKLARNQESNRMFSGAVKEYQFRVVEYEVFKVWF